MIAKFIFITFIIIIGLFAHRYYESRDLSIEQGQTTVSGVALSPTSAEVPETVKEKSIKRFDKIIKQALSENSSKYRMEKLATDERAYIEVPNPLSDEPIIFERQAKPYLQGGSSKVIYVPNPLSDTPLEITVNTDPADVNYYALVPNPLSDEPLILARQSGSYSQGDDNNVIQVPNPMSDTPVEFELDTTSTESNHYVEIPHPFSDESIFLDVQ